MTYPHEAWRRLEDEPPPMPFPKRGMPERLVLSEIKARLAKDRDPRKNFAVWAFWSHPIAKKALNLALDTHSVGELNLVYPEVYKMTHETVRMIGSLLGAKDPSGFITTGGTESNMSAVRLARNLKKKDRPEIVMPYTAHYSFHLAAELFGVRPRIARVDREYRPNMGDIRRLINKNTVALACSAYEPTLGAIDPVEEFGELAEKHDLYLHVDSCVGGFFLPFMRELGYSVPKFDFSIPGVSSMSADPHKQGLSVIPSSSFIMRDRGYLDAIPVEEVYLPTLSSSKSGASAVATWAVLKHLGMDAYKKYVKNSIDITRSLAESIRTIDGLDLLTEPRFNVLTFTSKKHDPFKINERMMRRGWTLFSGTLDPYPDKFVHFIVHPCKTKDIADELLDDLKKSVSESR